MNNECKALLVGDLCQFAAHQIQVGVDRLLVVLVDLGQGKQRDKGCKDNGKKLLKRFLVYILSLGLTQDDQSHAIEPGTNVGKHPQKTAKLDRIDEILNQKQTPQLRGKAIDMCHSHAGNVLHLLLRQRQIQLQVFPLISRFDTLYYLFIIL